MTRKDTEKHARAAAASAAVRGVRQAKGARPQDIAQHMNMEPRSYARFEAAEGQIDLRRLFQFCDATDCDPIALVTAIYFEEPDLAVRCRDAKLALLQMIVLDRALQRWGDGLRELDAATFISAIEGAFEELGRELEARSRYARRLIDTLKPDPDGD